MSDRYADADAARERDLDDEAAVNGPGGLRDESDLFSWLRGLAIEKKRSVAISGLVPRLWPLALDVIEAEKRLSDHQEGDSEMRRLAKAVDEAMWDFLEAAEKERGRFQRGDETR